MEAIPSRDFVSDIQALGCSFVLMIPSRQLSPALREKNNLLDLHALAGLPPWPMSPGRTQLLTGTLYLTAWPAGRCKAGVP